jgi:hypothetical protein
MSQTNRTPTLCNKCKNTIAAGVGTIRFWNGSARKHAPKYARRDAFGVLWATLCPTCEKERTDAAKIREYNRRHGFI